MNILDFIAKSNPRETIGEHTGLLLSAWEDTLELYGMHFSEKLRYMIRIASEFHDYGKSIYYFQKTMHQKVKEEIMIEGIDKLALEKLYPHGKFEKKIPHGYISAAFLNMKELRETLGGEELNIVVTAIVYHHTRDYTFDIAEIKKYIKNDLSIRLPNHKLQTLYSGYVYKENDFIEDKEWINYAVVKGMLNKLDYWASSKRINKIEISPYINGQSIGDLVEAYLIRKYGELRTLQEYMRDRKEKNLLVVASTGSGKTEAALLWLGASKGFYTLPLKVSINAIFERIMKFYGYPSDKIALLHADALAYLLEKEEHEESGDGVFHKYRASVLLSYPLTICTVDQLFTFIYKYKGSEILLAILKYSKLIIDEIQAYSPDIIGKLIYGLSLITKAGGKFSIITATLPPVLIHFMQKEKICFEPPKIFLSEKKRHSISYSDQDFNYTEILEMGKSKKVLVICNTVTKAQEVFRTLYENGGNVLLLHARYALKHKRMLEESILKFAENKELKGIWVCTQIVEASLDIDFDLLFTEMCTADSLLQRMGRCYRIREYTDNTPNIRIYDTRNGVRKDEDSNGIYDNYIYDRSVQFLIKYCDGIFTEERKLEYINNVYDTEELKGMKYYNEIKKTIKACKDIIPGIFTKEEAKRKFRDIQTLSVIPSGVYGIENRYGKIDDLVEQTGSKNEREAALAIKELKDYTISVQHYMQGNSREPFIPLLNIYRSDRKYEFNEESLLGVGLSKEKEIENTHM